MQIEYFKDAQHREAFCELLEQAEVIAAGEVEVGQLKKIKASDLLSRQIAFFYLIALYQRDIETYEGIPFYVEVYEEISLDGPVYLLDEKIGIPVHDYEWAVYFGKRIVMGETINLEQVPRSMRKFVEAAINMCSMV
ncbi:MAG: hypothetical protein RR448_06525 [Niameybacter sp.]|uniref:hypothetical protein n=1 Tax=Niameybacter sp. TaxID=2033640 RepID=UPI002FC8761F